MAQRMLRSFQLRFWYSEAGKVTHEVQLSEGKRVGTIPEAEI